jgi:hypothetical protein
VSKDADYLLRARAKADEVADENLYGDAVRAFQAAYQAGRAEAAAAAHEAGRREGVEAAVKYLREHFVKTDRTAADYFAAKIETALLPAPPPQAATCPCGLRWECCPRHENDTRRAAPPAAPAAERLCGNKDPSSPRRCTLPVGHEGVHDDSRWDDVTLRRRP